MALSLPSSLPCRICPQVLSTIRALRLVCPLMCVLYEGRALANLLSENLEESDPLQAVNTCTMNK